MTALINQIGFKILLYLGFFLCPIDSNAEQINIGIFLKLFPDANCIAILSDNNFDIIWKKNPTVMNPQKPYPSRFYNKALLIYSEKLDVAQKKIMQKSTLIIDDGKIHVPIEKKGGCISVSVKFTDAILSIRTNSIVWGNH